MVQSAEPMIYAKLPDAFAWDRRQHPICRPTKGERGAEARRFLKDFIQGAKAVEGACQNRDPTVL